MRLQMYAQILITLLITNSVPTVVAAQEIKCSFGPPRDGDWTATVRACSVLLEQSGNLIVTDRYGNTHPKRYILSIRANAYEKLNQIDKAIDDLNAAADRPEVLNEPGQTRRQHYLSQRDGLLLKQQKEVQTAQAGSCMASSIVQSFSKSYKLSPPITTAQFGDQRRCSVKAEINPCIKYAASYVQRYSQFKRISDDFQMKFNRGYELFSTLNLTYEQNGANVQNVEVRLGDSVNPLYGIILQRDGKKSLVSGPDLEIFRGSMDDVCILGEARDDNAFAMQFEQFLITHNGMLRR